MKTLIPSEKIESSRRWLPTIASVLLLSAVTPAVADTLFSFSTTQNSPAGNNYNENLISVSLATGLTSTASTQADITSALSEFDSYYNGNWAGFSVLSNNNGPLSSLSTDNWLSKEAFVFTLTRQEEYEWDLTSLDFLGARGGTGGARGFAIFASVDGVFDYDNDLLYSEANMPISYTRTAPHSYSLDLTNPRYADATSITFRYISLADIHTPGYSTEFSGFTVLGDIVAVPEPATWAMLPVSLGVLVAAFRLRRRGKFSPARI